MSSAAPLYCLRSLSLHSHRRPDQVYLHTCGAVSGKMSAYENVVVGKLKLKGKALDVKSGGVKKKKHKKLRDHAFQVTTGGSSGLSDNLYENDIETAKEQGGKHDSHLTPAERRYLEHWEKINIRRLAKEATKSHRDRIQEFNQYLANLSEHYDIPKVGPG